MGPDAFVSQGSPSLGAYDFAIITGDYLVHESRKLFEPFGGSDEKAYEDFVLKTEVFTAREVQNLPGFRFISAWEQRLGVRRLHDRHKEDFLATLSREWASSRGTRGRRRIFPIRAITPCPIPRCREWN